MRTKVIGALAAIAVAAVAAAYLAGYWPQRNLRLAAETRAGALEVKADAAAARLRVADLLGRTLMVKEQAMRQNYGQAQDGSSALFDEIRREAGMSPDPQLRNGLNTALAKRDGVTASLAKGDPVSTGMLHALEVDLRRALGYGVP